MIKGAMILGSGIIIGTGYGFLLGLRLSKAFDKMAEAVSTPASEEVVTGVAV